MAAPQSIIHLASENQKIPTFFCVAESKLHPTQATGNILKHV